MGRIPLRRTGEQRLYHAARQPIPAPFARDRHLPDEKGPRVGRRAVPGHPTDDPAPRFRDDAMVGEMRALDQVAIGGIAIERRAARDQRGDRRPVTGVGRQSEEHPSELQALMRISYAVFSWKEKNATVKETPLRKNRAGHSENNSNNDED